MIIITIIMIIIIITIIIIIIIATTIIMIIITSSSHHNHHHHYNYHHHNHHDNHHIILIYLFSKTSSFLIRSQYLSNFLLGEKPATPHNGVPPPSRQASRQNERPFEHIISMTDNEGWVRIIMRGVEGGREGEGGRERDREGERARERQLFYLNTV